MTRLALLLIRAVFWAVDLALTSLLFGALLWLAGYSALELWSAYPGLPAGWRVPVDLLGLGAPATVVYVFARNWARGYAP